MRVYTNPIVFAKEWEKRSDLYDKGLLEVHKILIMETLKDMYGLLSGKISARTLRQMGHPFARTRTSRKLIKGKYGSRNAHMSQTYGVKMRGVSRSYKRKYLGLFDIGSNHRKSMILNSIAPKSKLYDPRMANMVGAPNSQLTKRGDIKVFPINEQTGDLISKLKLIEVGGKGHVYHMFSDSPHNVVMTPGGTSNMVDRKIFGEFGMLRRFFKARLSGLVNMVRNVNRKVFP